MMMFYYPTRNEFLLFSYNFSARINGNAHHQSFVRNSGMFKQSPKVSWMSTVFQKEILKIRCLVEFDIPNFIKIQAPNHKDPKVNAQKFSLWNDDDCTTKRGISFFKFPTFSQDPNKHQFSIKIQDIKSNLPASSGLNSTSSHPKLLAYFTISLAISITSFSLFFSLYFIWISLVAIKVWIRGLFAYFTASHAVLISFLLHLASPQITGICPFSSTALPTSFAIIFTASRSSFDAAGNPASIISTPSFASWRAMSSFSLLVMVAPGDCSPSRRVVSKMRT